MAASAPPIPDSPPAEHDRRVQTVGGVFEPPSGFVLAALARNKLMICAFALVFALIGTAYGLSRQKTYTASATLQVGQVNPNSPGFYSYVQSASALAGAFSRAITAEPVLAAVQRELKLTPARTVGRLSAEPILQSPALRVTATGPSEPSAIQLANVGANALINYEGQSNSANPEAETLLHLYRDASIKLRRAEANLERLAHSVSRKRGTPTDVLAPDEAEKNAAEIRLKAIGVAYTAAVSSQAPRSGLVTLLAGATSASSNRRSKVEQFGFIGLLVGVVIGCAAATLRERRRSARQLSAAMQIEMPRSEPA
jgi:uncharacterized protein involved in exopolysaccharide biosynthesis